jgi:hypothetical protein
MNGMSSSGKTAAFNQLYAPLKQIQSEFDSEWNEQTSRMTDEAKSRTHMPHLIFRDIHVSTLVRYLMPDNPKGLVKHADEMMEWINGMNQGSRGNKEGTEEQFWLSSWNCTEYSPVRSGKMKYVNKRPFVNVIGGIQKSILHKLFANDRDSTGFVFRILFTEYQTKLPMIDEEFAIPEEIVKGYHKVIRVLYQSLPVTDFDQEPYNCVFDGAAKRFFQTYNKQKIYYLNNIQDAAEREIETGIWGKIKEYIYRFAAILAISDIAHNIDYVRDYHLHNSAFPAELVVTLNHLERAIELAEYFYLAAKNTYSLVSNNITAPIEVLEMAVLFNKGRSFAEMARHYFKLKDDSNIDNYRVRMHRVIAKFIKQYPKVFKADLRNK